MSATTVDREELRGRVAALQWYHTLELAPGVVTPGWFDLRRVAGRVPLPASLEGKRCLDVGTFDGFWAFEMERRGADEVVAIDVLDPAGWDWPPDSDPEVVAGMARRKGGGDGFEIARAALGSEVRRVELSVYDLGEADVGVFDLVYIGSLLLHLRDPVGALERVREVCRGELVVVDAIDPGLTVGHPRSPVARLDGRGRPWWWKPSQAGLVRMVEAAGFRVTTGPRRIWIPAGEGQSLPPLRPRLVLSRHGREAAITALKGDPHAGLVARRG